MFDQYEFVFAACIRPNDLAAAVVADNDCSVVKPEVLPPIGENFAQRHFVTDERVRHRSLEKLDRENGIREPIIGLDEPVSKRIVNALPGGKPGWTFGQK